MAIGGWAPKLSGGRVVTLSGGLGAGAFAGALAFGFLSLARLSATLALSYFWGGVVGSSPFGVFEFSLPVRELSIAWVLGAACLATGLLASMGGILGGAGGLLYKALLAPEAAPSSEGSSS